MTRVRPLLLLLAAVLVAAMATVLAPGAGEDRATVPTPGHLIYVFVPHADDDVLSMGVFIHQQIELGKDVHVVYYTDGAGTGVCLVDAQGVCQAHDAFHGLPVAQFIADRDTELEHSVEALGVAADHIEMYAPPHQPRRRDGTSDPAFAEQMLRYYRAKAPTATYLTMSWLDVHRDHRSAGVALRALVQQGVIPKAQALFTLARWYWAYDYPLRPARLTAAAQQLRATGGYPLAAQLLRCDDPTCLGAVDQAVLAYRSAQDGGTGYGIGYQSVHEYLDVTAGDPEVLLHGYDSGRYTAHAAFTTAARHAGGSSRTTVSGQLSVLSYGRYGRNDDDPAAAADLAQALLGPLVAQPLPKGSRVTLTALNRAGKVVGRAATKVAGGGRFSGPLDVPAGTVRITASTAGSTGVLPTTVSWPVAGQRVTVLRAAGVRIVHGVITGGYGRRLAVRVTSTLHGRVRTGVLASLTTAARDRLPARDVAAKTGRNGVVLTARIDRSGTWHASTAAPLPATVAALGAVLHTRVVPAILVVHPSRRRVRLHAHHGVLHGTVAGRDYGIPAALLVPVRVRIYLTRPGHPAKLLATTVTRPGGAFSVAVHSRAGGVLTYHVSARAGAFAANASAGTVRLHVA